MVDPVLFQLCQEVDHADGATGVGNGVYEPLTLRRVDLVVPPVPAEYGVLIGPATWPA